MANARHSKRSQEAQAGQAVQAVQAVDPEFESKRAEEQQRQQQQQRQQEEEARRAAELARMRQQFEFEEAERRLVIAREQAQGKLRYQERLRAETLELEAKVSTAVLGDVYRGVYGAKQTDQELQETRARHRREENDRLAREYDETARKLMQIEEEISRLRVAKRMFEAQAST